MGLPKTFKQAVFREAGSPLAVENAQLTPPGKGEILVKVEACGVCFSDMFAQNNILGGGLYVPPLLEAISSWYTPSSDRFCIQVEHAIIMSALTRGDLLAPLSLGHEIIGRVAAVGDDDSLWKVDDRIGGAWHGGHDGEPRDDPSSQNDAFNDGRYLQGMQKGYVPDV